MRDRCVCSTGGKSPWFIPGGRRDGNVQCLGVLEGEEVFVGATRSSHSFQKSGHKVSPWEGWKGLCSRKNPGIFVLEQGICACCLCWGRARNREKVGNRVMAWGKNGNQVGKSSPALLSWVRSKGIHFSGEEKPVGLHLGASQRVTQHSLCFLLRENVSASAEMFLWHKQPCASSQGSGHFAEKWDFLAMASHSPGKAFSVWNKQF